MTTLLDFLKTSEPPEPRIWDYISSSRLSLWMKCPLAFRLRYIDCILSRPNTNLVIGKAVHAALELLYRRRINNMPSTSEDVKTILGLAWKNVNEADPFVFDDSAHESKSREQVHDLVWCYLAEFDLAAENPATVEAKMELPLIDPTTGEDLGVPLLGIVDLILEGQTNEPKAKPTITDHLGGRSEPDWCQPVANDLTLLDFKTAASATSSCELQHEIQLTAYAYLVRETFSRDESAIEIRQLIKTKSPKVVTHRFPPRSAEHFSRFFGIAREYLDCLDRGKFMPRPGWGCTLCDFKSTCLGRC